MTSFEKYHNVQSIENTITGHFIYLHGILQNIEQQLKKKLYKQRFNFQKQINEFESLLTTQAENLASIAAICTTLDVNSDKINIKKLTKILLKLTDLPCHVIEENSDQLIRLEIDETVFDSIKQHIQLHVPEISKFKLVTTDQLPEKYEPESLPTDTTIKNLNYKISLKADASLPVIPFSLDSSSNTSIDDELEPLGMEKGNTERVRVTYVKNPTDFYVQKLSTIRLLDDTEAEMEKYVDNNSELPKHVLINRIYIVQNSKELKWCRGRVIKIVENADIEIIYEVFFIDYGVTESGITLDRLRNIQPQFMLISGLALHCALAEIVPMNGEWKSYVIDKFKTMVTGCTLEMQILYTNNVTYLVELRNKNNLSIQDWLTDTGLTKSITYHKLKRMNPLSAQQFYYEDLPLEKYTLVKVLHVESPSCLYVRKINNKDFREKMSSFYEQYGNLLKNTDLTVLYPEYGNTVALSDPPYWHRGIIIKICADKLKLHVFLVDDGTTMVVDYYKVTHLPNRFCSWNAQAIQVSLKNIKPIDDENWSAEIINYLRSNLKGKTVNIIPFSKTNETYTVYIYLCNNRNINSILVEMNLVQYTGNYSKGMLLKRDLNISTKLHMNIKNKSEFSYVSNAYNMKPTHESVPTIEDNDPFKVRVIIKKIISPDAIYVSETLNNEAYQNMIIEMQQFYKVNKCKLRCKLLSQYYYCVYSRKDKQYLRAEFLEILESEPPMAKMSLMDLGEVEDIDLRHIQPLDSRFFEVSKNIFIVKLAGIRPCGGTTVWQSSSCEKLTDIINYTRDTKYYITLINSAEDDESIYVDLFIRRNVDVGPTEPNRKETLSVARRLVEEGLALPIRGYVENEDRELGIELLKKLQLDVSCYENFKQLFAENKLTTESISISDNKIEIIDEQSTDSEYLNGELIKNESIKSNLFSNFNDWIPPNYSLKQTFNVIFTYVDYECDVYFHLDSKECRDTIQYINDTLTNYYNNRLIKKYIDWKKNDLCNVNYHLDKKWYRGKVEEVLSSQILRILFVDYGNIEECQIDNVDKEIILQDIPIQCIKAKIIGLTPKDDKWRESDLDIIHKLIVSRACKVTVVSEPSNPLTICIWIIENSSLYPLPLYIKNKTQVCCMTEDINRFYEFDWSNYHSKQTNLITSDLNISIDNSLHMTSINANNSNDLSKHEYFNLKIGTNSNSSNTEIVFTKQNRYDIVENEVIFQATTEIHRNDLLTTINNTWSRTPSKKSGSSGNLPIIMTMQDCEKMISGLENYYKNVKDFESATTEVLYNDLRNDNFSSSTSLDNFYHFHLSEDISHYIDFHMYKVKSFEMCIGQVFTEIRMSGYIINSSNKELNKWIDLCNQLQEQIQDAADEQPLFLAGSGQLCIVKFNDGLWYRARILKSGINNGSVLVEFIDYGNRIMIFDDNNIRTMRDEWLDIPWMSFHFKLFNVKVIPDHCEQFRETFIATLGSSDKYTALIKKHEPELELELYLDKECEKLAYTSLFDNNLLELINS